MRTLADQVVVHLAEDGRETVGVVQVPGPALVAGAQGVAEPNRPVLEHALEQARRMARSQLAHDLAGALLEHFEPVGAGHQGPDHHPVGCLVRTQHGERIVMARLHQRLNGRVGDAALRGANHTCPPARSTVPLATCECTINPSSPHSRSAKTIILIHGALLGKRNRERRNRFRELDRLCPFCPSPLTFKGHVEARGYPRYKTWPAGREQDVSTPHALARRPRAAA